MSDLSEVINEFNESDQQGLAKTIFYLVKEGQKKKGYSIRDLSYKTNSSYEIVEGVVNLLYARGVFTKIVHGQKRTTFYKVSKRYFH